MSVRLYYRDGFVIQMWDGLTVENLDDAKRVLIDEGYELVDVGRGDPLRPNAIPSYEFMRAEWSERE